MAETARIQSEPIAAGIPTMATDPDRYQHVIDIERTLNRLAATASGCPAVVVGATASD